MFRRIKNSESQGIAFTLISAMLWGIFPIIVNMWSYKFPPLFFAAILSIFAAIGSGIWMISRKKTKELLRKDAYIPLIMVSLYIVIIPSSLFFIGTAHTSGINSSVLMLSEIVFTLLFTPFFGEKNTLEKYIGSLGVMIGGALVLFNGKSISLNIGDIFILLSTITFPLGNFYSKRSLYLVSPSVVLTVRYGLGGIILLIISFIFEPIKTIQNSFTHNIPFLILVGCILLSLCKISFYEGMKRLDISKVISLEMTYPLFSIFFLILFFDTKILVHQILGIGIIIIGGFYAVKRKSDEHEKLKYKPKLT